MTAHADIGVGNAFFEKHRFSAALTKPIHMSDLGEVMDRFFSKA